MEILFFIISYAIFSYISEKIILILFKGKSIIILNIKLKRITKEIIQCILCAGIIALFINLFENVIIVAILSSILNSFFMNILDSTL